MGTGMERPGGRRHRWCGRAVRTAARRRRGCSVNRASHPSRGRPRTGYIGAPPGTKVRLRLACFLVTTPTAFGDSWPPQLAVNSPLHAFPTHFHSITSDTTPSANLASSSPPAAAPPCLAVSARRPPCAAPRDCLGVRFSAAGSASKATRSSSRAVLYCAAIRSSSSRDILPSPPSAMALTPPLVSAAGAQPSNWPSLVFFSSTSVDMTICLRPSDKPLRAFSSSLAAAT